MISFSVKNYLAVFIFAALIIVVGMSSYFALPRESFPEIRRPMIFVTTAYPGVGAYDIESLITREVESELDGIEGMDKVTSVSSEGVSRVTVEFDDSVDVETALRRVREKVDVAKVNFPDDATEPVVKELNFADFPVFIVSFAHPSGLEVLEGVSDLFEDEFKNVDGVLDVTVSGKPEKELEIALDPAKLFHYGLSIADVTTAVRDENTTIPGGQLKNQIKNYSLSVSGEIKNPQQFSEILVHKDGKKAKLKDLGTVSFGFAEPTSISRINGQPGITLTVKKRTGANLPVMAEALKDVLQRYKDLVPFGTKAYIAFNSADDVNTMVTDLENNIITGLLLVLFFTLFFLGFRNAVFVSLAIPFSMLCSFFILQVMGITLNNVVLFSLILALGMLVDNGIVLVENIYRHASMGKNNAEAAIDGAKEVALPVITSTLTTILAFFPIIFMPDIMGEFMSYIPKTVIIVLASSLFVALTINTAFCAKFMKVDRKAVESFSGGKGTFQKVQMIYSRMLKGAIRYRFLVLFISLALLITGGILNFRFGGGVLFFPRSDPRAAFIDIDAPTGTPITKTSTLVQQAEDHLRDIPSFANVDTWQVTVGRDGDPHKARLRVNFVPYTDRVTGTKETVEELRTLIKRLTGATYKVSAEQGGPPSGSDISYEIVGTNYSELGRIAELVEEQLVPFEDVLESYESDYEAAKPEIRIDVDREKAARFGLNTRMIASTIRNAMNGQKISEFRPTSDEYDVVVRFTEEYRNQLASLDGLQICNKGQEIYLTDVATISYRSTVVTVKRKNRERNVTVFGNFKEKVAEKPFYKAQIEEKVNALQSQIPSGYILRTGEGQAKQQEAQAFLVRAFMIAVGLIFLILVLQFNSFMQPFIILTSVLLSLGGVMWGYFLTHEMFVIIMSGIGIISLAGVVVNNSIVLIDYTNMLKRDGMNPRDAIIEAGRTRLRPVMLTAITTVAGLLPMALGISIDVYTGTILLDTESSHFWAPMSRTVCYGLIFATIMTLIVTPCLLSMQFDLERFLMRASQPEFWKSLRGSGSTDPSWFRRWRGRAK
jgi:multidrug efflux pump